jgi:hypothetical protein
MSKQVLEVVVVGGVQAYTQQSWPVRPGLVLVGQPQNETNLVTAWTHVAVATRKNTRGGDDDSCKAWAPPSVASTYNNTGERFGFRQALAEAGVSDNYKEQSFFFWQSIPYIFIKINNTW